MIRQSTIFTHHGNIFIQLTASVKLLSLIDHTKRFSFPAQLNCLQPLQPGPEKINSTLFGRSHHVIAFLLGTIRKKSRANEPARNTDDERKGNKAVAFSRLKGDIFTYTYEIGVVNMAEQMTLSIKI